MRLLGLSFIPVFSMLAFTAPAPAAPGSVGPSFELVSCGNGVLEQGEDCDDGNIAPGDCCAPTCQFESASTECRPAAGVCDAVEYCDGAGGACAPDGKLTTVCRPAAHICDAAEFCDGVSDNCPIMDLPANGLACPDGDLCNGHEICVGFVCMPGEPLVWRSGGPTNTLRTTLRWKCIALWLETGA